jgi:hypothetical protein
MMRAFSVPAEPSGGAADGVVSARQWARRWTPAANRFPNRHRAGGSNAVHQHGALSPSAIAQSNEAPQRVQLFMV